MIEIRFHGRGGQGTVLAVKMLADAVLRAGKAECMAIPEFGVERRGAPVRAYARVAEGRILVRTRIYNPDVVVVFDPAFADDETVVEGLKDGGTVFMNTDRDPAEFAKRWPQFRTIIFDAQKIALAHGLGSPASPMVNTAVMGALCAALDLADPDSLAAAIRGAVPAKIEENLAAAREACDLITKENAHAAS